MGVGGEGGKGVFTAKVSWVVVVCLEDRKLICCDEWMSRQELLNGGRMRLKMVLYLLHVGGRGGLRVLLGVVVSCRTLWPSPASERRIGAPLALPWKKFAMMD